MRRLTTIDFVRGVVMIIMALDHVRDMIHVDAITQSPTNLATTSPALFFTRWITYLCAPAFVFLAGTSVYLSCRKDGDTSDRVRFLRKRGLYLILLEFTVVNFSLYLDLHFHTLIFEVIAAIGFSFIILSLLLRLPSLAVGIIGLIIICSHNLFSSIPFAEASLVKKILTPLFAPTAYPFSGRVFIMAYPPLPWLGIMLAGYGAGSLFAIPDLRQKKLLVKIGLSAIGLFLLLRFINSYGDPLPWSSQKDALFTFLSFMNLTKYPPSLDFCLVTLGIVFLILAIAAGRRGGLINFAAVYGKVPLFYFVLHFFLVHFILIGLLLLQGFKWSELSFASGTFGRPAGVSGLPLWAVYIVWMAVVTILYSPCKWFGSYKATHSQWWLRYI